MQTKPTAPHRGRPQIAPGCHPHCLRIPNDLFDDLRDIGLGSASAGIIQLHKLYLALRPKPR